MYLHESICDRMINVTARHSVLSPTKTVFSLQLRKDILLKEFDVILEFGGVNPALNNSKLLLFNKSFTGDLS